MYMLDFSYLIVMLKNEWIACATWVEYYLHVLQEEGKG